MELIAPYLVACVLLVAAGGAKAWRPGDTARAMGELLGRRMRAPSPRAMRVAVRTGAAAEAALGLVALAWPRPVTASLVAVSYAGFSGVVVAARASGSPLATCGCFATPDSPATGVHLVLDLALAAAAAGVAAGAPATGSLGGVLAHQPWHGVVLVLLVGLGAWLAGLAFTLLGSLEAVRRATGPGS